MKHWDYKINGAWFHIWCTTAQQDDPEAIKPFGVRRAIVRELKEIERIIKDAPNIAGWLCSTEIDKGYMMRFLAKLGGVPYSMDLKQDLLWFKKEI